MRTPTGRHTPARARAVFPSTSVVRQAVASLRTPLSSGPASCGAVLSLWRPSYLADARPLALRPRLATGLPLNWLFEGVFGVRERGLDAAGPVFEAPGRVKQRRDIVILRLIWPTTS